MRVVCIIVAVCANQIYFSSPEEQQCTRSESNMSVLPPPAALAARPENQRALKKKRPELSLVGRVNLARNSCGCSDPKCRDVASVEVSKVDPVEVPKVDLVELSNVAPHICCFYSCLYPLRSSEGLFTVSSDMLLSKPLTAKETEVGVDEGWPKICSESDP